MAEAAKDSLRLLDRVERQREPAILVRAGRPVATLRPLPGVAMTCGGLADRWPKLDKLSPDEATAFADDLESARASLPPGHPAWD